MSSDDDLIEAMARDMARAKWQGIFPPKILDQQVDRFWKMEVPVATAALAAIRKTHAVVPLAQAHDAPDEKYDPTNPFAPRERPKKSIRLMTDAERRAAGLDPNGGFDGPTGAD